MASIQGPERHGKRWRIRIDHGRKRCPETGKRYISFSYATKAEAQRKRELFRRELDKGSRLIEDAVERYVRELRDERECRPSHWTQTDIRIRAMFGSELSRPMSWLTPAKGEVLYDSYRKRPTRTGRPPAVTTQLNVLAQAKTFGTWLVEEQYLGQNPFSHVKPKGRRRRGKPQHTIDEARKYTAQALLQTAVEEIIAAALPPLCGLCPSEIVEREARDIDDDGRLWRVPSGKTENRVRTVVIPPVLRPAVAQLRAGKAPTDRLFPGRDRHWVRRVVQRVCRLANVPVIGPQAMRGTHSTLATKAGATGVLVAEQLGHSSFEVTRRHYLKPGADEQAHQERVLRVLEGGKR